MVHVKCLSPISAIHAAHRIAASTGLCTLVCYRPASATPYQVESSPGGNVRPSAWPVCSGSDDAEPESVMPAPDKLQFLNMVRWGSG